MQQKEFRAKKDNKNIKTLVQKAREFVKEKRFEEAITIYDDVLKENPDAAGAYMGIGAIHMRKGDFDEAEKYFNGALHVTKQVAPVLNMLANVAQKRGDLNKALKLNQDALDIDPKFMKAAIGMGKVLFQTQRYDEAMKTISEAQKYNPNSNEAEILRSRILQKTGQPDEAIENLNKLLLRDPRSWSAYFQQAMMHLRDKKFESAIKAAKKSLEIKPDHARASICLSQALIGSKQYIKAIDILGDVMMRYPEMWNVKMLLARSYFLNGDLEEAKVLLSKMSLGRRGLGSVHFLLGDIFEAKELYSDAIKEYEAGVLHSEELVQKYPRLKELADKEMSEGDKIAEFKKILTEIREKSNDDALNE